MGSSTNCSTRPCLRTPFPPVMWWPCICIAVPLRMPLPMKTWNKILIVGAVIPPTVKKPGKSSANGSGTCAWNWATSFILTPYARPSLPLPPRRLSHTLLPPRAMLLPRWGYPGKRAASRVRTSFSSQMAPCVARQASRSLPMSDAGKRMEACAWSMPPASAVVVRVHCENNVNGRAVRRRSRRPRECALASPHRRFPASALA